MPPLSWILKPDLELEQNTRPLQNNSGNTRLRGYVAILGSGQNKNNEKYNLAMQLRSLFSFLL